MQANDKKDNKEKISSKMRNKAIFKLIIIMIFFIIVIPAAVYSIAAKPILTISLIAVPFVIWYGFCRYSETRPDTAFLTFVCDVLPSFYLPYIFLVVITIVGSILYGLKARYYCYDQSVYCKFSEGFYLYNASTSDYEPIAKDELPSELSASFKDYRMETDSLSNVTAFEDSAYYKGVITQTEAENETETGSMIALGSLDEEEK